MAPHPFLKEQILHGLKVSSGIVKAVGVIDPQSRDLALRNQTHYEMVRRRQHTRVFDPQAGEGIHIEETSVVNFMKGCFPIGQAVSLGFKQLMKQVKTFRLTRLAVKHRDRLLDMLFYRVRLFCQTRQTFLGDGFFPAALRYAIGSRFRLCGKILELGQDA